MGILFHSVLIRINHSIPNYQFALKMSAPTDKANSTGDASISNSITDQPSQDTETVNAGVIDDEEESDNSRLARFFAGLIKRERQPSQDTEPVDNKESEEPSK
ncbi:hypothetical protein M426DRAFT_6751 [Hypoxylon sp. CI-4A]|nr:hypothetical protein M426DRAFT_6751 [Hypoxylon sp. CI-4A]